jgi:glycosyltransferase involved in cell wall biosynthesis
MLTYWNDDGVLRAGRSWFGASAGVCEPLKCRMERSKGIAVKIGIDIRELERGKMTGIGRFLSNFIAYARQARPQYQFILYGNQHTVTGIGDGNVIERIRDEGWTQWWDQVLLPKMANADGVDVFFSPYIKGPLRVRCPLVVTIHDLMDLVFPEYGSGALARFLFKQMAVRVGRRADLVLADSQHSAGDIARLLHLQRNKVEVLPIGLEERYQPVKDGEVLSQVQRKYDIEASYIFYLGNFKPHKNVQGLIETYASLAEPMRADFQLVLGGREDRWSHERNALAEALGIASRVRFIGSVEEGDMPALFSGAALFVFPSLYEGFGLPPLEAMACGAPVLCSDRTSLPEVVGSAGILFDPDDKEGWSQSLSALLGNSSERKTMVEKSLQRAQLFRADALCERQMQLLERVSSQREN